MSLKITDLRTEEAQTLVALLNNEPLPDDGFWVTNLRAAGLVNVQGNLTDTGRELVA